MTTSPEQDEKRTDAQIRETARRTFSAAARHYVSSAAHRSGSDLERLLAVAAERLGGLEGRLALDVATGGGHVALALARAGARVTATDLTPEMLAEARTFLLRQELAAPVDFREADAGLLPFDRSSFDLVTCRIAAHHFPDPLEFLRESARTLRPGGLLVLVDNIAPEDPELAQAMNELERRRDGSHVEAYSVAWWVAGLVRAGLEPVHLERFWREKPFREWAGRTPPGDKDPEVHADDVEEFLRGLPARARTYLGERNDDEGRLASLRHEVIIVAAERRDRPKRPRRD